MSKILAKFKKILIKRLTKQTNKNLVKFEQYIKPIIIPLLVPCSTSLTTHLQSTFPDYVLIRAASRQIMKVMSNNESTAQLVSNANGDYDSLRKDNRTANTGSQGQTGSNFVTSSWQKKRKQNTSLWSLDTADLDCVPFSICDLVFGSQSNIMQLKMRKVLCTM